QRRSRLRLRLLIPRRRRGAGLGRLTQRPVAAATACALAVGVGGCGSAHERAPTPHAGAGIAPSAAPVFGLTENNAALLWSPAIGDPRATGLAGVAAPDRRRIVAARQMLTALHPRFVRLLVNWAALQPDPARPAELA